MQFVTFLHNLLRWAVLLFGVWTVVNAITGVSGKRPYTTKDGKINLFFMISCDIQLLIGLVLYFAGPWFGLMKTNAADVMKDSNLRFFAVEHITMMLLAIVLVHIGRSSVKKAVTDATKHKKSLILFGIAIILIFASIPWHIRPLFRGL